MNAADPPVRPGDVIAGKYRVERVLGVGGMGVVVAVTHLELLELRAIKLMRPEGRADADAVERFAREARAASLLKSEHVARVMDVGRFADGAPYMVMEYLEGADLAAALKRAGAMPVEEAVLYVLQAAEALAEAHALGIVHRDLKPANLFLTLRPDGAPCVKVLDFGISKVLGSPAENDLTRSHELLGSPNYMSPEQMHETRLADARSDLWSLGVILYQLLTRELPFRGRSITEIITAVLQGRPAPPSQLRPELPRALDPVVLRCLERDPAQRFANMGELALALAPFCSGSGPLVGSILRIAAAPARSSAGLPVAVLSESQRLALAPRPSPPSPASVTLPRAPSAVVLADDSLTARASPIALGFTPVLEAAAPRTPDGPPSATGAWGGTSGGTPRRSRTALMMVAVAIAAVGGLLAVGVSIGRSTLPSPAGAASPGAAATTAPAPVPTEARTPPAPVEPVATVSAASTSTSAAASASASASAAGRGRRPPAPHADPFGMDRK